MTKATKSDGGLVIVNNERRHSRTSKIHLNINYDLIPSHITCIIMRGDGNKNENVKPSTSGGIIWFIVITNQETY